MCKNLNPSGCHQLESRMRLKVQVRFAGSQTEKEQQCHLAGWLPYSKSGPLGFHRPPLSGGQVGLSHRNCRGKVIMDQRNHACLGSRP